MVKGLLRVYTMYCVCALHLNRAYKGNERVQAPAIEARTLDAGAFILKAERAYPDLAMTCHDMSSILSQRRVPILIMSQS